VLIISLVSAIELLPMVAPAGAWAADDGKRLPHCAS
jgi:hypothetical protein